METSEIPTKLKSSIILDNLDDGSNRYACSLEKVLPPDDELVTMKFELHNNIWQFQTNYANCALEVNIMCSGHYAEPWDIRVGIVNQFGEEIANSKAKYLYDTFSVLKLIQRSEIVSMKQSLKEMRFFIEIKRRESEATQIRNAEIQKLQSDYEEMLNSGRNSDLTIQVKRRKFSCHRCVLGTRSPVFSAMMESDMTEKATGEVIINDAEPTVFQEFLLYLYTGDGKHLSWKNVVELYKLGDKYVVENLKKLCIKNIKERISMENFAYFFELSQLHNDSEMTNGIVPFFLKNSVAIVESQMWMDLLIKMPTSCNVLIKALAKKSLSK